MLNTLVTQSGVPASQLEAEIRTIHQRHGTSEYSYLIEDIPSLQAMHPTGDLRTIYHDAIEAYGEARRTTLTLYPGVRHTLEEIKRAGSRIVAYTESLSYVTAQRIRKMDLDGLIDVLYSPADHDFPPGVSANDLRSFPEEKYAPKLTRMEHTLPGELKPNPARLASDSRPVGREVYLRTVCRRQFDERHRHGSKCPSVRRLGKVWSGSS